MYDTLSGQEIFGPNGVTFQGTTNVNHIDGISAIGVEVLFNDDKLPEKICLSVQFDGRYDMSGGAVIQEN